MLLEVVEADDGVDLVPVVNAGIGKIRRGELQVNVLVKQNIEKGDEQNLYRITNVRSL